MPTTLGPERAVASLLLQDVAAIPILALVPLLGVAATRAPVDVGHGWLGAAQGDRRHRASSSSAAGCCCGRRCAGSRAASTPEIFTAASLLLVVATAALMQAVGLSMALGAFLAGVLLAESEYRRELETDIEPFKGLLLGLFFIAVGMSIDFASCSRSRGLVAGRRRRLPAAEGDRAVARWRARCRFRWPSGRCS